MKGEGSKKSFFLTRLRSLDGYTQTYLCRPREIILRQFHDWSIIQQQLNLVEKEGLITMKQLDTLVISITTNGIEALKEQGSEV